MMDQFIKALWSFALFVAAVLLGCVVGAIAGWFASLIMGEAILAAFAAFGVRTASLELWQIGAMLGFIGPFFRPVSVSPQQQVTMHGDGVGPDHQKIVQLADQIKRDAR